MRTLVCILSLIFLSASCNSKSRYNKQAPEKIESTPNAFNNVTNSIEESMINLKEEIQLMQEYAYQFADSLLLDSLKNITAENIHFIDSIKNVMKENASGEGDKLITNKIMMDEGNALKMKNRLLSYQNFINKHLTMPNLLLDTNTARNAGKTWEQYCFENVPVIAANTILTKFEHDILLDEMSLLTQLIEK